MSKIYTTIQICWQWPFPDSIYSCYLKNYKITQSALYCRSTGLIYHRIQHVYYLATTVSLLVAFPSFSPWTLDSKPDCVSLSVLPRLCVTSPMILETISLVSDSTVLAAVSLHESASNCDSLCVDERQLSVVTDEWRRRRSCGTGSSFIRSISADVRSHRGKWSYKNTTCEVMNKQTEIETNSYQSINPWSHRSRKRFIWKSIQDKEIMPHVSTTT